MTFIGDNTQQCFSFGNVSQISSIFPTFEEIHGSVTGIFKVPASVLNSLGQEFPPTNLIPDIPDLPTVPSLKCMFGSVKKPSVAGAFSAIGVYVGQQFAVMQEMLEKLFTFIGRIPFPKMPEFDFDLVDLMVKKPIDLIKKIAAKAIAAAESQITEMVDEVKQQIGEIKEAIEGSSELFMQVVEKYGGSIKEFWKNFKMNLKPMIPPLFLTFDNPMLELITSVVGAGISYVGMLIEFATGVIKKFLAYLDDLEISYPSFPTLPTVPSFSEVIGKVSEVIGEYVTEGKQQAVEFMANMKQQAELFVTDQIQDINAILDESMGNLRSIVDAMRNISFPDFNFKIPDPIFPTFDKPFVEMVYGYFAMTSQMFGTVVKKLKDYVDTLPLISEVVRWPTIKKWLGDIPSVSEICAANINNTINDAVSDAKGVVNGTIQENTSYAENSMIQMANTVNQTREAAGEIAKDTTNSIQDAFDHMDTIAESTCGEISSGLKRLS